MTRPKSRLITRREHSEGHTPVIQLRAKDIGSKVEGGSFPPERRHADETLKEKKVKRGSSPDRPEYGRRRLRIRAGNNSLKTARAPRRDAMVWCEQQRHEGQVIGDDRPIRTRENP